jgi:REP element-mobilizing transposase RayT
MEDAGRKHPIHLPAKDWFNTSTIIFVTVCTKARKPILSTNSAHQLLQHAWQIRPSWLIGRYVIMPDHVHLFCAPADLTPQPLIKWISFWKSHVTTHWADPMQLPVWQRHFWDTQLRRSENYDMKWDYVVQNPVRAGLVARAEDWPFQGEINSLEW